MFLDRPPKKEYNTPIWKQSVLSNHELARQPEIIKYIFKKCPVCGNNSLKPNYNLQRLVSKNEIYEIVTKNGRVCSRCKYIIGASPLYKDEEGLY